MDSPADNAPPEPALEPQDPPVNLPLQDQQPADPADESVDTTVTAAQHPLPDLSAGLNGAAYAPPSPEHPRPSTSYSDTGFNRPYSSDHNSAPHGYHNFSTPSDADTPPRYHNGGSRPMSRPGSGMAYHHSDGGSRTYQEQNQRGSQQGMGDKQNTSVVIKVGMVGDAQIGKTSLMVKYVEGSWDEDYIQTLGVNFMEKTISIRNTEITFSIWDLGGQREFVNMLPLVCNDAVAILFMFDLTRKSTLNSIKEWYRQGRGFNKTAIPFLVGTKYDHFVNFPREEQEEISNQAKRFAKAMKASLIFSSTSHSINVQKIFKIVLSKAFDLRCTIPEIENVGEPLLLYQSVG
ncbi:Septum-promoting GTP-binding protein 1 [Lasiodiplodia hormozganensis]|uniref:Septum-promoting GTP-binding protein 1 n=2 Tax=Lasiodiplodia TaxID=66739 RepID=A0A5N5DHD0_9PEZI|nr:Septum-promoting GTP-binding protein 1 [Lasiodiplodia theobromae]KAB2576452.1 Septum-promoting GTP-binding protein 1 [Lasiodiplodia theobromae]KAF4543946.1 Septum-promoting GTP-binding protein 1 [Lasiodiplodia theobromae]KAK0664320.1 Septum-promoting GTP-binding protein 1 [Lasiodiplodia hormozganensis]